VGRWYESDLRLNRLYDTIEGGVANQDDPELKTRIAPLKATRDQARVDADRAAALLETISQKSITPPMLRKFASTARDQMRLPCRRYRRDHLRALAQRIEVDEGEVHIMGSKGDLLRTPAGAADPMGAVPSFAQNWRRERDCCRTFSDTNGPIH
jgi:site-specific DNA recombinase